MGIYDEVRSWTGSGVMVGPALSADEAHALGLSSVNPLVDELERSYERYVTENPEESAARIWNAERVGVPLWVATVLNLLINGRADSEHPWYETCIYLEAAGKTLPVFKWQHQHQLTHVLAKDPTTSEVGNIEYWYCPVCG